MWFVCLIEFFLFWYQGSISPLTRQCTLGIEVVYTTMLSLYATYTLLQKNIHIVDLWILKKTEYHWLWNRECRPVYRHDISTCAHTMQISREDTRKHLSNEKKNWLFTAYRGIILPNYIGIIINHYKDPVFNQPGWLMESKGPRVFWPWLIWLKGLWCNTPWKANKYPTENWLFWSNYSGSLTRPMGPQMVVE